MYGYYSVHNAPGLAAAFGREAAKEQAFGAYLEDERVKFPDNHFVLETEKRIAACCGYVLNDAELIKTAGESDLSAFLFNAPLEKPLPDLLKGAYAAAIYDKGKECLTLTNDKLSKQPLYYWISGGDLLFSTRFFALAEAVKKLGQTLTPDPMAVSMMVKTGALWEDFTYAKEIHALTPFRYLTASPDGVRVVALPFPTVDFHADADAAIAKIDGLFTEAVRLQYEKNANAGYRQLGSLSGGMDSRALLVRAEQLGFRDDLAFTYAQSGSLDMEISQRVAAHYGILHLFFSMDNGGFLTDREAFTAGNEGQEVYCGSTGVLKVIETLDTAPFGLVHTGIGGGEIFGDIIPAEGDTPEGDVHLEKLLSLLDCPDESGVHRLRAAREAYPTFNVFRQLNDVRTNTNFMRTISRRLPAASPFLYEDFFEFLMTLPIAMKGFRRLYYRWVEQKLRLPYRTTDASLPVLTGTMAERYARQELRNIQKRMKTMNRYEMNPFDRWIAENPALSAYLADTWAEDIAALSKLSSELTASLQRDYAKASGRGKFSILTATWALKKLIS